MNDSLKKILIIVGLVCFIILFGIIYFAPYIINNYSFAIGFDSGAYLYKIQTNNYTFWDEPLFFNWFIPFQKITGLDNLILFKSIAFILAIPFILITYLFSKKISGDKGSSLIALIFLCTSGLFLNGFYLSFYRQQFSFLLFLTLIYLISLMWENEGWPKIVLISLLFVAVFLSHKAIALLSLATMFSLLAYKRDKKSLIYFLSIIFLSLFILSPYLLPLIPKYLQTIYESFILTIKGASSMGSVPRDVVGKSLVNADGLINPLIDFIIFAPIISFFSYLGIFTYLRYKDRSSRMFGWLLIFSITFLSFWSLIQANFSNRFILNLSFLMIPFAALFLGNSIKKGKILVFIIFLFFVSLLLISITFSMEQKPYVTKNLESMQFIQLNIDKNNSIIFAPDYMQTILSQQEYTTPLVYSPLNFNYLDNKEDGLSLTKSDDFLLSGHQDLSLVQNYNLSEKNIYVVFGKWDLSHVLPRSTVKGKINLSSWDNSNYFETIYRGENEIIRIYHLK